MADSAHDRMDYPPEVEEEMYFANLESTVPDPRLREPGNPFDWYEDLPVTESEALKAYREGRHHDAFAGALFLKMEQAWQAMLDREEAARKRREDGKKARQVKTDRDAVDRAERNNTWLRLREEILAESGAKKKYRGRKWKWNLAREVLTRELHENQEYVSDADLEEALTDGKIKYCRDEMSKLLK